MRGRPGTSPGRTAPAGGTDGHVTGGEAPEGATAGGAAPPSGPAVAVVGLGAVGLRAARQLADRAGRRPAGRLLLADRRVGRAEAAAASLGPGAEVADADRILGEAELVCLAGPVPHVPWAERAVAAGLHVVSCSDDPDDVAGLLALGEGAGRTVVVGAGFDPGLSCLAARWLADGFDEVERVTVAHAGTAGPACARRHHRTLRRRGVVVTADGELVEVPPRTGRRLVWFPDPVGPRDCYRGALAAPLLVRRVIPGAEVSALVAAGRRDRWTARLPMLRPPHPEGVLGAVWVEVCGTVGGAAEVAVVGAVDRPGVAAGAVMAEAAERVLAHPGPGGARGVAELAPGAAEMLAALAARGVRIARFTGGG